MSLRYLLDTNVLSEPLRRRPNAAVVERLNEAAGAVAIPSTVWHELVYGVARLAAGPRRSFLERFLLESVRSAIEILPYDERAAQWHGLERARLEKVGRSTSTADGQIAAVAATRGLVLVTRNVRDFAAFESLPVEDWFARA